jgi:hypothetical protein
MVDENLKQQFPNRGKSCNECKLSDHAINSPTCRDYKWGSLASKKCLPG